MSQKNLLIIISILFLLSLSLNVYQFRKPKEIQVDSSLVEYYRNSIYVLNNKIKFQELQLKEKPKQINKIITRYEKIHDTINLYTPMQVDSCYSSELRFYRDNREAFNIKRFYRP